MNTNGRSLARPDEQLEASTALNARLWQMTRAGEFTARRVVSDCAMSLAHEHHASICTLIRHYNFASATALLRPLLESTVTAAWATYSASQGKLMSLLEQQGDLPEVTRMMLEVDRAHPGVFELSTMLKGDGRIFHAFTHGGVEQLRRRMNVSGTPYNRDENCLTLGLADYLLLIAMSVHSAWFSDPVLDGILRFETDKLIPELLNRFAAGKTVPAWPGWHRLPPPNPEGADVVLQPGMIPNKRSS